MPKRRSVTSNMLEEAGLIYRATFSDNKQALIDNHMMLQKEIQSGKRKWTYYKTTPLGKVLAMKSWLSGNKQIDSTRPPDESIFSEDIIKALSKNDLALATGAKWYRKLPHKNRKNLLTVMQRDLLGSFFQHIPRLEKYDNLLNNQSMSEVHNALRLAFLDIDINSRFAFTITGRKEEYGVEVNFPAEYKMEVRVIKYFHAPGNKQDEYVKKLFNYILDSITFIVLRNLKQLKKYQRYEHDPIITKILNDHDLKIFYKKYLNQLQLKV